MNRTMTWILLAVLAVSLLFNMSMARRLADMDTRLNATLSTTNHNVNILSSEVDRLRNQLEQLQQEAAWYQRPELEVLGGNELCTAANVNLTWSFNELASNAEVGLSYRVGGEGDWREASIQHIAGTTYRAKLQVPLDQLEPMFSMEYAWDETGNHISNKASATDGKPLPVEYVIHASENGEEKSGAQEHQDLSKLLGRFHSTINEVKAGERYSVTVYSERIGLQCSEVNSVEFLAIGESGTEKILELDEDPATSNAPADATPAKRKWEGTLDLGEPHELEHFVVRVIMENGAQYEHAVTVE